MVHVTKELIDGETCLVGVLGDPVRHSLSPVIHNAALTALNLNWCYLAIPCQSNNFELIVQALRRIECKGLNITIPHKKHALNVCNEVQSLAKHVGAVNTLIPTKDNHWRGANTDVEGFLSPLKSYNEWNQKNVLLIGCGGSAKAVIYALNTLKVSKITVVSRNSNTLETFINNVRFSKNISSKVIGLVSNDVSIADEIKYADLIINTTPVGMYKNQTSSQIPLGKEVWQNLQPETILYDLIYTPNPTEWLKLGEKFGCQKIDGLEMLIQQGASSLRLWSGLQNMPIDIMRKAAQKALQGLN